MSNNGKTTRLVVRLAAQDMVPLMVFGSLGSKKFILYNLNM